MKKFLKTILFLCAISSLAYAEEATAVATSSSGMSAEEQKEAMDILDRMREKIEKEEAEKAKLAAEARELGISPSEVASMDNVEEMIEVKRAEEAKPKTEAERMDVEVQRIKKRMMEINDKIENYNKTNEMIDNLEKNVGELERKVNY